MATSVSRGHTVLHAAVSLCEVTCMRRLASLKRKQGLHSTYICPALLS